MRVHQISAPPSPALAEALAEFEAHFTYPLGVGKYFRISHGEDYTRFFRAQGNGVCFIAEHQSRVVGALGTAIRQLRMPDGTEQPVAYFGDLKIAAEFRGGRVLAQLAQAADGWLRPQVGAGFGVVMGGTTLTPETYTGRVGIPGFQELGRLAILRISGGESQEPPSERFLSDRPSVLDCYQRLSVGRFACPAAITEHRSKITPVWLITPGSSACGMLEDTRKAKILFAGEGMEMLSAHLSCFAYGSVSEGAELIGVALSLEKNSGLPALFLSVPERDAPALCDSLHRYEVLVATAVVYGTGLAKADWNINTSEI